MSKDAKVELSSGVFADRISDMNGQTPVADSFGDRDDLCKEYPAESLHEVQRKHIVTWFKSKGEDSARAVYERLQDPAMLLWIAESVNVDKKTIQDAAKDAEGKYKSPEFAAKCGKTGSALTSHQAVIIRSKINWSLIVEHINTVHA
jgi:hypothetical protein